MAYTLPVPQTAFVGCVAAVVLLAGVARSVAADVEQREYLTYIDGRKAGEYHMTITPQDDGSVSMTGKANVNVGFLLVRYTYAYRGTEVWKDGRLQRFDSATNDNGTRYTVSAAADGDGLRVQVNGQPRTGRADAWVTTYWHLPPAAQRNQELSLLDGDTGRDLTATLAYVGAEQVNVAGQTVECGHYRLTGQVVNVDLWYDAQERLVRQEWMEDRHKAVLQLTGVRR
jgi:hypothetical protein